jgi:hypothetical protein
MTVAVSNRLSLLVTVEGPQSRVVGQTHPMQNHRKPGSNVNRIREVHVELVEAKAQFWR